MSDRLGAARTIAQAGGEGETTILEGTESLRLQNDAAQTGLAGLPTRLRSDRDSN
jgi:hypothetical protein